MSRCKRHILTCFNPFLYPTSAIFWKFFLINHSFTSSRLPGRSYMCIVQSWLDFLIPASSFSKFFRIGRWDYFFFTLYFSHLISLFPKLHYVTYPLSISATVSTSLLPLLYDIVLHISFRFPSSDLISYFPIMFSCSSSAISNFAFSKSVLGGDYGPGGAGQPQT